jgi:hypothetical protein|uniref:Uncharacterized protein n=1 Tax=Phaeodactylum tricornutum TaxID=2850 RepID=A0A8J9X0W3_PHATR
MIPTTSRQAFVVVATTFATLVVGSRAAFFPAQPSSPSTCPRPSQTSARSVFQHKRISQGRATRIPTTRFHKQQISCSPTALCVCSVHGQRRDVTIPLLDLIIAETDEDSYLSEEDELTESMVQPLPSTHLPDELTTLNVYGMQLSRPVHKRIIQDALERGERNGVGELNGMEKVFGHVAYKPNANSLIGAIGCTAEILMQANIGDLDGDDDNIVDPEEDTIPQTVLCRGSYRFIVKELVQTIPFPVAIVDELCDEETGSLTTNGTIVSAVEEDEEDDDEEDMIDDHATPAELEKRCMVAMKDYVDQQLDVLIRDMTPLEQSILEDTDNRVNLTAQRHAAEEAAAVYSVFEQYLVDLCPGPTERYFAVAFLAAEMANMENDVRRTILRLTNGIDRLRYVTHALEEVVGMARARRMAHAITDPVNDDRESTDENSLMNLKVGTPALPPWAKSIRQGMRVEYYWNEVEGWCEGTVMEEPIQIVDEIIMTVRFSDGETHRLPFTADEKVRWRPPQQSSE